MILKEETKVIDGFEHVLRLERLDAPVRVNSTLTTRYRLEYEWQYIYRSGSHAPGAPMAAAGIKTWANEFSFWPYAEVKGYKLKSLFELFSLIS